MNPNLKAEERVEERKCIPNRGNMCEGLEAGGCGPLPEEDKGLWVAMQNSKMMGCLRTGYGQGEARPMLQEAQGS